MNLVTAAGQAGPVRDGLDPAEPFTPAMAARAGIGRSTLERRVRDGELVRLVRGVYLASDATLDPLGRARALALVLGRRHVVVDRTAAWVHGAPDLTTAPGAALPLDVLGRRTYPGAPVPVLRDEVSVVGGVRCTTPLRTALDVARRLAPERALPLLDGLLAAGSLSHAELLRAAADAPWDLPGITQARELAAAADPRARGVAESVLRMHWLAARLPTPAPGWEVAGVRLALGLPVHRFGVVLTSCCTADERDAVRRSGWTVVVLDEHRVRCSDAGSAGGHLVREFHRHLLDQMG